MTSRDVNHLARAVLGTQEELRDRHRERDGGLLQQHDDSRVTDVVHSENAHDPRHAVQETHHGELVLGNGLLLTRDGRPEGNSNRNSTWNGVPWQRKPVYVLYIKGASLSRERH